MFDSYLGFVLLLAVCYGIIAISYQMVLSAGVLQAAHAALVGFGAYTGAVVTARLGLPFWLAIPAGIVATGLVSVPLSLLSLRLGHFFLVVATLGFGEVLVILALNSDYLGAAMGLGGMPLASGPVVIFGGLAITMWIALRTQNSRVGQALLAIGQDDIAASAVGINVHRERVRIFVITGAMAGGAGVLLAHLVGFVAPSQMNFYSTVTLFIFVIVGGLYSPVGAFLGATILTLAPEMLRFSDDISLLLYGVVVVLMTIFRPRGLLSRRPVKAAKVLPEQGEQAQLPPAEFLSGASARDASQEAPGRSDDELVIEGVGKAFAGVVALSDVSFRCKTGAITGVIGPNGAGKTTLFNIISGLETIDEGGIVFAGSDVTAEPAHHRVERGMARTFQNIRLFPDMTAFENVMVARYSRGRSRIWHAALRLGVDRAERAEAAQNAASLLDFVGLRAHADTPAKDLPYGDQRRLEVARALATEPRLLLLDEPSAGMNPTEQGAFVDLIRRIFDLGITVVLIEHNIPLVMELCDHVVVLNFGAVIAEGSAAEVRSSPEVIQAYFGSAPEVTDQGPLAEEPSTSDAL